MSAAPSAAAMIRLVISIWFATGPRGAPPPSGPPRPVRRWGASERIAASSSLGIAPVIWAATVDPADVPMIRSASVTSSPASNRPATTPISHALPADPPPARTNARSPAPRARLVGSTCGISTQTSRAPTPENSRPPRCHCPCSAPTQLPTWGCRPRSRIPPPPPRYA